MHIIVIVDKTALLVHSLPYKILLDLSIRRELDHPVLTSLYNVFRNSNFFYRARSCIKP
jgi:hypothetical protein